MTIRQLIQELLNHKDIDQIVVMYGNDDVEKEIEEVEHCPWGIFLNARGEELQQKQYGKW